MERTSFEKKFELINLTFINSIRDLSPMRLIDKALKSTMNTCRTEKHSKFLRKVVSKCKKPLIINLSR